MAGAFRHLLAVLTAVSCRLTLYPTEVGHEADSVCFYELCRRGVVGVLGH